MSQRPNGRYAQSMGAMPKSSRMKSQPRLMAASSAQNGRRKSGSRHSQPRSSFGLVRAGSHTQLYNGEEYDVTDLHVAIAGPSTRAHGGALKTLTIVAQKGPYKEVPFIWGKQVSAGLRMDDEKRAVKVHCLDVEPEQPIGLVNQDYELLIVAVKAEGKRSYKWCRKHKDLFSEQPTLFLLAVPDFVADSEDEDPEANKPVKRIFNQFGRWLRNKCKYKVEPGQIITYDHETTVQNFKYAMREKIRDLMAGTKKGRDWNDLLLTMDRRDEVAYEAWKKQKRKERRRERKARKRAKREERRKHRQNQSVATPSGLHMGDSGSSSASFGDLKRYHTVHGKVDDYQGDVMPLEPYIPADRQQPNNQRSRPRVSSTDDDDDEKQ